MATMESVGQSGLLFKQEGNKILNTLRAQRQEGKYCDVTLTVQDEKHVAHRSILAASSPYFEKLLKNQRIPKEGIAIDWPDSKSFELLVDYLYSGEILLHEDNIDDVVQLADHFMINKLKSHCEEYFRQFVSLENCLKIKDMIDSYNLTGVRDAINQFIADHITDVLTLTALLELSFEKFGCFIADPATGCDSISHHTLLTAISSWVKYDLSERANDFPNLLEVVNWSDADASEIIQHIEKEPLYQESRECLYYMLRALVKSNVEIGTYAEVYEELCDKFQDTLHASEQTAVAVTNLPEEQPASSSPTTRRGTRSRPAVTAAAAPAQPVTPSRSSARKRPAPPVKQQPQEEDEDQEQEAEETTTSGRPSRRRQKPKAFSSDWVTDDDADHSSRTAVTTSTPAAKRPKRAPTIVKIEAVGENGEPIPGQAEIGIEVNDYEDENGEEDSAEETANETITNQDDEEAALKRIAARSKSLNHVTKSQWKQGIKCEDCTYLAYSAARLDQHFQKVHAEAQTFTCRQCDFECKWNREYYKHMKSHYDGPPYKCDDCEYTCDRIQFILSHRMKHTDERPFGCELCDFSSRTKGNLIVHMRIHTGEKPYRCQHCGRCFAMKNTLDQHMATHRDDRPFLCDTCGFTTKYKSHLLSHERIHTGNVFHCEEKGCNYFSPRRSQLAAHMRSHQMIRSHICSTCGRGFIEKSHLIRHERIHLETKPFKCDSCDYGSTRRDKLKEHKLKYHSGEGGTPAAASSASSSAAKSSSYRSRSKRNAAARNLGRMLGQGDVQVEEDDEQGTMTHVVHITNGDEEDMDEQNVATAYLIDEYENCDGTGQATRIVLQGDFGEQAVFVEGQPGSVDGDDSGEAGEVIVIHTATADE